MAPLLSVVRKPSPQPGMRQGRCTLGIGCSYKPPPTAVVGSLARENVVGFGAQSGCCGAAGTKELVTTAGDESKIEPFTLE